MRRAREKNLVVSPPMRKRAINIKIIVRELFRERTIVSVTA